MLVAIGLVGLIGLSAWFLGGDPADPVDVVAGPVKGAPIDAPLVVSEDPVMSGPDPAETLGKYTALHFNKLASYKFRFAWPPKPGVDESTPIPEEILALDGQKFSVTGYVQPLDAVRGRATRFMLMRNQSFCCYGKPLDLNEWIEVRVPNGRAIKVKQDIPMVASGKLEVGKESEQGWIVNIYRMVVEDLVPVGGDDAKPKPLPPRSAA